MIFHIGCTNKHTYQECIRVPISSYLHQYNANFLFCSDFGASHKDRCEINSACAFLINYFY